MLEVLRKCVSCVHQACLVPVGKPQKKRPPRRPLWYPVHCYLRIGIGFSISEAKGIKVRAAVRPVALQQNAVARLQGANDLLHVFDGIYQDIV